MKYVTEPFPNDEGIPVSEQDKLLQREEQDTQRHSAAQAQEYLKMILSTMK